MVIERIVRPGRSAVPQSGDGALVAPFQFVLGGTEFLRAVVLADGANTEVIIQGRMLRPSGEVHPFAYRLRTSAALMQVTEEYPLGPGALLTVFASARSSSGQNEWADTYVALSIVQGRGDAGVELGVLVHSYLGFRMPAVWPGTPFRSSLEGPGKSIVLTGGNTAGVGPYTFTGSTGYRLKVRSFKFQLTTDATVGNRRVVLDLFRGSTLCLSIGALATQAATTANLYNCMAGGVDRDNTAAFRQNLALPADFYLHDGDKIQIEWGAPGGANDQITAVVLYAERWLVLPGLGEL